MFDVAVGAWITLIVVLVIIVAVLGAALFIVPQQQAYIIERFGKFNKVQFAGIHLKIPFVDRIAMKTNMRVSQINVQLGNQDARQRVRDRGGLHAVPREPAGRGHRLLRAARSGGPAALLYGGRAAFRDPGPEPG